MKQYNVKLVQQKTERKNCYFMLMRDIKKEKYKLRLVENILIK
jgi:hypothetical protein